MSDKRIYEDWHDALDTSERVARNAIEYTESLIDKDKRFALAMVARRTARLLQYLAEKLELEEGEHMGNEKVDLEMPDLTGSVERVRVAWARLRPHG